MLIVTNKKLFEEVQRYKLQADISSRMLGRLINEFGRTITKWKEKRIGCARTIYRLEDMLYETIRELHAGSTSDKQEESEA